MTMKRALLWGSLLLASSGLALVAGLALTEKEAAAATDPRLQDPVVLLATTAPVAGRDRSFTGVIAARVESGLGFRVGGKITARLVSTGEMVHAGQPLMRIDDTDLQLALAAKRNAVEAARASVSQLAPDEQRYARLLASGWIARQRYEQARAALDAARAQLSAAEADARVAANQTGYTELVADADGTVVATLGEPGQVVAAGQAVLRIARAGPREALVTLPEGMRPEIGSLASASVYGEGTTRHAARLRELSDAADPQTRTYEARYVLEGAAAAAPLGATVTIRFNEASDRPGVEVPIGALRDTGNRIGLWELDTATETVHFRDVRLVSLGDETAVVSGPEAGTPIVALGAQLLEEGQRVRARPAKGDAR